MSDDTHIVSFAGQRRWPKVTLLQFGRRTASESACSASRTALSALSIRLPVYLPTFSISLWVYLVCLTCLVGLYFTLPASLFSSPFLLVKASVCFKKRPCEVKETSYLHKFRLTVQQACQLHAWSDVLMGESIYNLKFFFYYFILHTTTYVTFHVQNKGQPHECLLGETISLLKDT